ncbi:hypothetical protein D499_0O00740 [Hanseniaspora uvarum DSM 2768]|nr:hypothetical protein D499_0O00740 [Hanseniaspora uvarum DSM 2768]
MDLTTYSKFAILGLVNNSLYVIILSLAMDLTSKNTPKSLILLLNILPALILKSLAPILIHNRVSHVKRVVCLIIINSLAMWLIAFKKVYLGIILASLMSGLGELTFLQIASSKFGENGINGWSVGTGFAGICGSLFVLIITSFLRFSITTCLLGSSLIPLGFFLYWTLPQNEYHQMDNIDLTQNSMATEENFEDDHIDKLGLVKELLYTFMLPLMLVYFAEYLINQGITPVLLFPLKDHSIIFRKYRDQYVLYGTVYQLGVLISRSSGNYMRIKNVWFLSILQVINLFMLLIEALYFPIESVYFIIFCSFYEGLLGGSSYVNVFLNVNEIYRNSSSHKREFCMGVVTISDSFGILFAALTGLVLEPNLCKHQVANGRNYCKSS